MLRFVIASFFMAFSGAVFAQSPSHHYDWRSGNSITTTPKPYGGAQVRGFNGRTGTSWNTDIDTRGNMRGFDAKGNNWNYNKSTNTYMNFGTGKTCVNGFCNR